MRPPMGSVLIPDSAQMKRASPPSGKATEAELMNNPWNAMYNDRVGGMGGGWAERAAGPDVQKWNKLADQYRWEAKFIPGGSYTGGSNPFAWVESYSQADTEAAQEAERKEREHHANLINARKGGFLGQMSADEIKKRTNLSPQQARAEAAREARMKEIEKKLGVDKVELDHMKLRALPASQP